MAKRLRKKRLVALITIPLLIVGSAGGVWALHSSNVKKESIDSRKLLSSEDVEQEKAQQALKEKQEKILTEIKSTGAGSSVDVSELTPDQVQSLFYLEPLSAELLSSMEGVTYVSGYDFIAPEDLRLVRILYKDYEGSNCVGELIVNEEIAEDAKAVFQELYEINYPIAQVVLPDVYGGDDNLSMANNNSSGFSFRLSDGVGVAVHEHSMGLAIDLNPLQNPQIIDNEGTTLVFPYNAEPWADRTVVQDHMITHEDPAYEIFTKYGFSWGGDWSQRQDYMHFEKGWDPSLYQVIG